MSAPAVVPARRVAGYTLEVGVPIPPKLRPARRKPNLHRAIKALTVGESIAVSIREAAPRVIANRVRANAALALGRGGYAVRIVNNTVRVWRLK